MWMLHYSNVFDVVIVVFLLHLKNLERMTYLNEFGEDFGHNTVHDLYRESAKWHVAQSSEEDANMATWIYYTNGEWPEEGASWQVLERIIEGFLRLVEESVFFSHHTPMNGQMWLCSIFGNAQI